MAAQGIDEVQRGGRGEHTIVARPRQIDDVFLDDAARPRRHDEHPVGERDRVLDRWMGPTRRQEDRAGIRSQDMEVWEQQQRARQSPVADEVLFSPVWEPNVHHFQNMLVDVMAGSNRG